MSREADIARFAANIVGTVKRLNESQGRIARRNARHHVLREMRRLRVVMDEWFPHERKPSKSRVAATARRIARAVATTSTVPNHVAIELAALGIKIEPFNGAFAYAPSWAVKLWTANIDRPTRADIKRARRDIPFRHTLLARVTLSQAGQEQPRW